MATSNCIIPTAHTMALVQGPCMLPNRHDKNQKCGGVILFRETQAGHGDILVISNSELRTHYELFYR